MSSFPARVGHSTTRKTVHATSSHRAKSYSIYVAGDVTCLPRASAAMTELAMVTPQTDEKRWVRTWIRWVVLVLQLVMSQQSEYAPKG